MHDKRFVDAIIYGYELYHKIAELQDTRKCPTTSVELRTKSITKLYMVVQKKKKKKKI